MHMNTFFRRLIVPGILLIVICACNLENNASDSGLYPGFYGQGPIPGVRGGIGGRGVNAHTCCERDADASGGPAAWAIDGDFTRWWHTCTVAGEGYSIATGSTGHVGDSNYLKRGDSGRVDGYTWTTDVNEAVGGADPWTVDDVTPGPHGAHWITLDLGEEVEVPAGEIGSIGYYFRGFTAISATDTRLRSTDAGRLGGRNGVSYELCVSKKDFGWIVNDPDVIHVGTGVATGLGANCIDGYEYFGFQPELAITFRYIQIRWVFDNVVGGTDKIASATNFTFNVRSGEVDYTYLTVAYITGKKLLATIPFSSRDHRPLRILLEGLDNPTTGEVVVLGAERALAPPLPEEKNNVPNILRKQAQVDSAADALLREIYRINPPEIPPEVIL